MRSRIFVRPTPIRKSSSTLQKIQPTLDEFSGRFIVHGGALEIREGAWPGDLVIIEFPNIAKARVWYESPAYQKLLPLRTRHTVADTILVEGVEPDR